MTIPLVTVITISYEHLEGLRRTLDSVAMQDWEWIESVVIDGGSSDGTAAFLERYEPEFQQMVLSEPDEGIYDAMNKGISHASGDLVVFMNAGDTFADSSVISRMASSYAREGSWRWGYGCGRVLRGFKPTAVLAFIPFRLDRLALGLATVPHQAVVMELSLLRELDGFDRRAGLSADQDLLLRAALRSTPRLWAEFFVDFEGGGAGSTRKPLAYPKEMRQARRRNDASVGGSWAIDTLLTALLLAVRTMSTWQHSLRRRWAHEVRHPRRARRRSY